MIQFTIGSKLYLQAFWVRKGIWEIGDTYAQGSMHNPSMLSCEFRRMIFNESRFFSSEQANIFAETAYPVCENVVTGYNGTIFAYGQTGTGKTFTITGVPKDPV